MSSNKNPTAEELQQGAEELRRSAAELIDLLTTVLAQLRDIHRGMVDAGKLIGMSWPEVAAVTGKPTGDAARQDYGKQ